MKPSSTDFVTVCAQLSLAFMTTIGFLVTLFYLIRFHAQLDNETNALLTGMVGILGTIVTQQNGYFFQRQRPDSVQDAPALANAPDPLPPSAPPGAAHAVPIPIVPVHPAPVPVQPAAATPHAPAGAPISRPAV